MPSSVTVIEIDHTPTPLLYDAHGNPLCLPQRRIGFHYDHD